MGEKSSTSAKEAAFVKKFTRVLRGSQVGEFWAGSAVATLKLCRGSYKHLGAILKLVNGSHSHLRGHSEAFSKVAISSWGPL